MLKSPAHIIVKSKVIRPKQFEFVFRGEKLNDFIHYYYVFVPFCARILLYLALSVYNEIFLQLKGFKCSGKVMIMSM